METDCALEEYFINITVPFDCQFLVAQKKEGYNILTEVYHVSPALPLQTYRFGKWSPHVGVSWPSLPFYQRRRSLQNTVLRAGVLQV
jgi:hypothetical protein